MSPTERLVFIPPEEFAVPGSGQFEHFRDHWWTTDAEGRLAFYWFGQRPRRFRPQCNSDERISRKLTSELYPDLEVRQVPSVFVRINGDGEYLVPKEYR